MRKLFVPLSEHDLTLLREIAHQEFRRPPDQAAVMLARALAACVELKSEDKSEVSNETR